MWVCEECHSVTCEPGVCVFDKTRNPNGLFAGRCSGCDKVRDVVQCPHGLGQRTTYVIRGDNMHLSSMDGRGEFSREPDDAVELTELEALRFFYRNRDSRYVHTRIERRVYRPCFEGQPYEAE